MQETTDDPWTLYWQSDCLDSCITSKSVQDAAAVREFWAAIASELEPNAQVLDLATGNGTVPVALLRAASSLAITAVDKASIDPLQFLSAPGVLAAVDFRANVDICALPFDDGAFDAVTSQFGIEYAPLEDAIAEAVRVTKSAGRLQFLSHHVDSEIVAPARDSLKEMNALLQEDGVLAQLSAYLAGDVPEALLDASGRAHMEAGGRTQKITGQIFTGINRAITLRESGNQDDAEALSKVMQNRLGADRDRLTQLDSAALNGEAFDAFVGLLEGAGVRTELAQEMRANKGRSDEFLLGWTYSGVRPAA